MADSVSSSVLHAGEQIIADEAYRFDNSNRPTPDYYVVQRTISGKISFKLKGQQHWVGAGRAMLFTHREDSAYAYSDPHRTPYRQHYVAFVPSPALAELFLDLRRKFGSIIAMPPRAECTALLGEVINRFLRGTFVDRFHETELIYRLLLALHREQVRAVRIDDPIEYGRQCLLDRFRRPLNLKTVAATCGVSREHFIREFRKRFRETPGAMLQRLRLEHGRTLVISTNLPLEEVALASGFANRGSFTRAYRRLFRSDPRSCCHKAGVDGPLPAQHPGGA